MIKFLSAFLFYGIMKIQLLTIQSTSLCNLNCSYCYLPDRQVNSKFELDLLSILFENLIKSNLIGNELTIAWHAGEPFILPANYYKDAFEIIENIKPKHCEITHSFQSNGTLITEEYCKLLLNYKVNIGISIDGPSFIHDKFRVNWNGKKTLAKTIAGIQMLNAHKITFHTIVVLSKFSLSYPDEIFNYLISLGTKAIALNLEETEGINTSSSVNSTDDENLYKEFINKFYNLTKDSKQEIVIREFNRMKRRITSKEGTVKNGIIEPLYYLTIDTKGYYSTFSPELLNITSTKYENFIIGDVKKDKISDSIKTEKFKQIYNDIKNGVEKCKLECDYFDLCGGGTPSNKLHENGTFDSSTTMYCTFSKKYLADVIIENLEREIDSTY